MEEEDELLQSIHKQLSLFGKKNERRFRILDDLSLSCDACKTPEAKNDIRAMTQRYFDELMREQASMNNNLQKLLSQKKELKKKGLSKDFGKKAGKIFDKFSALHIGRGKLTLKIKDFKNLPLLQFEMKL